MAIQSSYIAEDFGFTAVSAYTKISSFYVQNEGANSKIVIFTETFYDETARYGGKQQIGTNTYSMPVIESFTFVDMYAFIKEQPEFLNSIDLI